MGSETKEVIKMDSFLFMSPFIDFQETDEGVNVKVTFMELDKSSVNGRIYRFNEGKQIAKSMLGKPVFFGTKIKCEGTVCKRVHDLSKQPIGFIETAKVVGKKIVGKIRVTCSDLIKKIKEGKKFWLSVGGIADKAKFTGKWNSKMKPIIKLIGAIVSHVSILPLKAMAGFKTAKIEGFEETIMIDKENIEIIEDYIKKERQSLISEEIGNIIRAEIIAVSIREALRKRGLID